MKIVYPSLLNWIITIILIGKELQAKEMKAHQIKTKEDPEVVSVSDVTTQVTGLVTAQQ